ncbi:Uma2 family endonuclease [Streptomyces sp. C10-9-1]|uniref:Uma2 family endonuclease n=1 Tax=Streptomyces sp. C10-9-1 TaxID=1859285 RepID=UPI002111243A|nr:Uma2 family endonuclease [Streptomyces sp. C10-9-1]MCQ6552364.1 Uma2 family endonuclease [Streptomyces sp. C10-9-1]
MSVEALVHTEFPQGYTVLFGAGGKVVTTPRSEEHSSTTGPMRIDSPALGRHAKVASGACVGFPADENSAPDPAVLREDARREGKRHGFEDVLPIPGAVSTPSAGGDDDDCTATYGRYGIPVHPVVDPDAQDAVRHTRPTGSGHIAARTHTYGTGKRPVPPAGGRTLTLDLDELPVPEAESSAR